MAQPGPESTWLWIGTAIMALGTVAFLVLGWGEEDREKQAFFIITTFVPAIAFVSYFSMVTGFGLVELSVPWQAEPLAIYWARYADWLFTTPLLLIDLGLLAGADRNTIGTLVGLDVGMISTGLIATLTTASQGVRLAWWGISSGFFLVLLYVLVSQLTAQAADRPADVGTLFGRLRNLTILVWTAYPVVWLVGTEGLGVVSLGAETAVFMVLDVTAKVGFGFLLLRSRAVLDQVTTDRQEAAAV